MSTMLGLLFGFGLGCGYQWLKRNGHLEWNS